MIGVALFASFLAPAFYAASILVLLSILVVDRGMRKHAPLPVGLMPLIGILLAFGALAVLGPTLTYGSNGQNVDAFKFLFVTGSFFIGAMIGAQHRNIDRLLALFLAVLTAYYAVQYTTRELLNQESFLYPPDNNHSAAMVAVWLPFILMRVKGSMRWLCLVLIVALSFFVASRALLALTLVSFALSTRAVQANRWMVLPILPAALVILFYQGFSADNFSDRLRLQILEVSFNFATTRGAHAFNFGEAAFADFLNIFPIYRRLEIAHAHNLILQIWVAYGIVPLLMFGAWLAALAQHGWRNRNWLLLSSLAVMLAFGMIEALITDYRAFGTMLLTLGFVLALEHKVAAPRDTTSNPPSAQPH